MSYRYVLFSPPELAWLSDVLAWRGNRVASIVPGDAAVVLRLRHPAYRVGAAGRPEPLRWAEAVPDVAVRPESQFADLVGYLDYDNGPRDERGPWQIGPTKGTLPRTLARKLASALPASSPWRFGVWAGFASVTPTADPAARFTTGDRSYYLLEGEAADLGESLSPSDWRAPNLWWNEDRSWWVHTDIDRSDTFIAVSRRLADRLLARLSPYECLEAGPNDPLYPELPGFLPLFSAERPDRAVLVKRGAQNRGDR